MMKKSALPVGWSSQNISLQEKREDGNIFSSAVSRQDLHGSEYCNAVPMEARFSYSERMLFLIRFELRIGETIIARRII